MFSECDRSYHPRSSIPSAFDYRPWHRENHQGEIDFSVALARHSMFPYSSEYERTLVRRAMLAELASASSSPRMHATPHMLGLRSTVVTPPISSSISSPMRPQPTDFSLDREAPMFPSLPDTHPNARKGVDLSSKPKHHIKRTSEEAWDMMFHRLVDYKRVHGHCLVPRDCKDDPKLAKWVMNQRVRRKNLSKRRMDKLLSIDFVWRIIQKNPDQAWNEMHNRLVVYKALHGDCCVPVKYADDPKLGRWVHTQRFHKKFLDENRKQRLNAIGFVWSVSQESWDGMFERLEKFKLLHGHCNVARDYKEDPKLGMWVMNQRLRQKNIPEHRVERLRDLGFSW